VHRVHRLTKIPDHLRAALVSRSRGPAHRFLLLGVLACAAAASGSHGRLVTPVAALSANLALAAPTCIACSSRSDSPADRVRDGDPETMWASDAADTAFPHRIKVDWASPRPVARVVARFSEGGVNGGVLNQDFALQYWSASDGWVTLPGAQFSGVTQREVAVDVRPPVTTVAVRVLITRSTNGIASVAELEAYEDVPVAPPPSGVCGYDNGGTLYDASGNAWTIAPDFTTMRNGVHFGGGYAIRLFVKDGTIYADNTWWADRWYVAGSSGWTYAGAQSCSAASAPFKAAFWNMQYGAGALQHPGGVCPYGANYGDSAAGRANAWNSGHQREYINTYVQNDPAVIAYGVVEANSGSVRPPAIATHLGWAYVGATTTDGTSLYARYGFKGAPIEARLPRCSLDDMDMVFGKVFRTAEAAAANSDDYVNVVATHFRHADAGTCGSSDAQGQFVRNFLAAYTDLTKPTIVLGDLNVMVEEAVDQRIWNYQPYGPGTTFWYRDSVYPWHMSAWRDAGFADAWRSIYPLPESGPDRSAVLTTRPGFTSTWGGGPYYGPLWKRIDYALVKGGRVADIRLFNEQLETLYDPATGVYRQNIKDCKASDHAGLVVTVE